MIKNILILCGYDHQIAFENFNRDEIKVIEDFINENFTVKPDIFRGSVYEQSDCFKFLPGHRAILLSLAELAKKVKESKTQKKLNKKTKVNLLVQNNGDSITEDNLVESLLKKLIEKLNKFSEKIHLNIEFQPNHISNVKTENDSVKCHVRCPSCSMNTPCIYKSYWLVSNIEKHLKSHVEPGTQTDNQRLLNNTNTENSHNQSLAQSPLNNSNSENNYIIGRFDISSISSSSSTQITPNNSTNSNSNEQLVHRIKITNQELHAILKGKKIKIG